MVRYVVQVGDHGSVGLLHVMKLLDEIDMAPNDANARCYAEEDVDRDLPVPEMSVFSGNTESWFTDEGQARFGAQMTTLCRVAEIYLSGLGYHTEILTRPPATSVLYRDPWQVVHKSEQTVDQMEQIRDVIESEYRRLKARGEA